ncbi:Zn(II)2Cys6 transcription factor [Rhizodiscina lignyota]|uniref:Zn(II)2Cys6 transcription factor n=1 Tax=Rhizodiscina lignyota TaxID=1504668 RepID=A0A9P4I878_9PEZI|nr:Zn(II)2Cys6 transcription factor [Rhizodiscina lignyota]
MAPNESNSSKQAACLLCRKSKVKCNRDTGGIACERCQQMGAECVVPDFHVGRQKGVKNKRTGLDKAIFQIEQAIKKSKTESPANERAVSELQNLVNEARHTFPRSEFTSPSTPVNRTSDHEAQQSSGEDQLALDDAENPLQLLARASDLRVASPETTDNRSPFINASTPSTRHHHSEHGDRSEVNRFFLPMRATTENGDDTDPIDLGLVTIEEADMLLTFFHEKLAHTRWGLDPKVHTLNFIRNQSSFLFTSLLAAAALFLPTTAALAKRLATHRTTMAHRVITQRKRSVEIVLAFLVNVPWMHPGSHSADDDTGLYLSTALSIALDLSLNKIIVPSLGFNRELLKRIAKGDCIDSRKALSMDGFDDLELGSEWAQRLLRRRERAWVALYVLERGVCLARGRNYSVPITPLIENCDTWHEFNLADPRDGSLTSMAVLRRELDGLFSTVRARCDSYRVIDVGSHVAREIEASIENFYDRWLAKWTAAIGEGENRTLPPYVEILVTHTRLSTYSGVINHPTAPIEVKRFFRSAGLSSSLNVMRAAIQGESRLMSMPNNTAIMISFAGCVALNLCAQNHGGPNNLAPSVRKLIEEAAGVLERIGSTPSHRNGASILYGKYLRELVRQTPILPKLQEKDSVSAVPPPPTFLNTSMTNSSIPYPQSEQTQTQHQAQAQYQPTPFWPEPLQFSAMSDNEIIETVLRAGSGFDTSLPDIPFDDTSGLVWSDWMNAPEFGF